MDPAEFLKSTTGQQVWVQTRAGHLFSGRVNVFDQALLNLHDTLLHEDGQEYHLNSLDVPVSEIASAWQLPETRSAR